jgi:hypothetical protein
VSARRRGGGAPGGGEDRGSTHGGGQLLFTFRASVDTFKEGFFPEEPFGAGQELERAFDEELKRTRGPSEEPYLGFPSSTPGELVEVVESGSSNVRYVAFDPDASGQEV